MIARMWHRLGLMSRLAISGGAVLAMLTVVLIVGFVGRETELRSAEYAERLDSSLTMLVGALTGPAILGDYTGATELLSAFAQQSDVEHIEWAPVRSRPVSVPGVLVVRTAPAWFAALVDFPAHAGSRRIVVGGTDYGAVSLRLDPIPELNKIWAQVAGGTVIVAVGVLTMLGLMLLTVEHGLRSLARLVNGVRSFERGDFAVRVREGGPPEIASTIVAFNRMAERVGAGFDSLRDSEAKNRRLATIVEQSNESILTRDLHGTITSWNKGAERLFGWSAAEAIGKAAPDLNGNGIVDEGYALDLSRISSSATWASEGTRVVKNGTVRNVSVTRAPMLDEAGEVIGEIRIARDVTELKKAQALLIAAKEELEARVLQRTAQLALARDESEAANRSKSAFLAAMSHEIRTPMNGVVGMIDVLEQSHLRSSQTEIVKIIRESAHALLGIVDDVLDFSKIEAGQFQVEIAPMDVARVVEGVCATLDPLAIQKGVALTLFTDPAIPARVMGDPSRLRQVLLNLIGNAIKFSSSREKPGRVSVRAAVVERDARPTLEFAVSDNGIGMDAETLSRLFTPFTQADSSTTRRYGGTGLGLSISHRLVELMDGELDVKSVLREGSAFVLRLPALPANAATSAAAVPCDLTGLRCLVEGAQGGASDDWAVYLADDGASVHRVADPRATRDWLLHCRPGPWIVVTAGASGDPLAAVRAVGRSRPDLDLRFVAIDRTPDPVPRVAADDVAHLGGLLLRGDLVKAVARIAGRAAEEAPEDPPTDTAPAPLSSEDASAQGRLILIAEDNDINQKVLRQQLRLLGFTAHIAGNGREALECLSHGDYPLLLTDLHMPQMDGYELAVAIREREAGGRRMAIVALTANAVKGEADHCRALGMDDYMTKPVQLADLSAMLRKWLPAPDGAIPSGGTAAVAAAPAPRALDLSVLEELVGDDPRVIAGFLSDFRVSAGQAAIAIRAACRAREPAAAGALAHKLKSSARSMGALALGEMCAKIEAAGSASRCDILDDLWPQFQSEMASVEEFLSAAHES